MSPARGSVLESSFARYWEKSIDTRAGREAEVLQIDLGRVSCLSLV